ncbi:MAG: hypothetical protein PHZ11_09915 [Desulfitobacteriaceae bacterium]|nr:hypothetical protein [Desulfitobacteriaceae bacterium]
MRTLSELLKTKLIAAGASLVRFADISELPGKQRQDFNFGKSIAIALDPAGVRGNISTYKMKPLQRLSDVEILHDIT